MLDLAKFLIISTNRGIMTTIFNFADKKVLTSDFNPAEMLAISAVSESDGRKYFITKYFLPLVYSLWNKPDIGMGDACCLHLLPKDGGLQPTAFFEDSIQMKAKRVDYVRQRINETWYKNSLTEIFTVKFTEQQLYEALAITFSRCLPQNYLASSPLNIGECVLIASANREREGTGHKINLNVMIKTPESVRASIFETLAVNQADRRDAPDMMRVSKKYSKMYHVYDGKWTDMCDVGDPDECAECKAIRAAGVEESIYNDPSFT